MKIQIEFFHDVLCPWCFVMSRRVRRLVQENTDIEIIHRCFPIVSSPKFIENTFGSREAWKKEMLKECHMANISDDEPRIKVELMENRKFEYPISVPGLLACKAAELQGGYEAHWNMFDRIQNALFVECLNISDFNVLKVCAKDIGLDVKKWEEDYHSDVCSQNFLSDVQITLDYGIESLPTLVANKEYWIVGTFKYKDLSKWLVFVRKRYRKKFKVR